MDKLSSLSVGDRFRLSDGKIYVLDHHDTTTSHCVGPNMDTHLLYSRSIVETEDDLSTDEYDLSDLEYEPTEVEYTETFWNKIAKINL